MCVWVCGGGDGGLGVWRCGGGGGCVGVWVCGGVGVGVWRCGGVGVGVGVWVCGGLGVGVGVGVWVCGCVGVRVDLSSCCCCSRVPDEETYTRTLFIVPVMLSHLRAGACDFTAPASGLAPGAHGGPAILARLVALPFPLLPPGHSCATPSAKARLVTATGGHSGGGCSPLSPPFAAP